MLFFPLFLGFWAFFVTALVASHVQLEDHFHLNSLSAVHTYDLYHIHIISLSSYNGDMTKIAFEIGLVSRRSWVQIPLEPQKFFWALFVTA